MFTKLFAESGLSLDRLRALLEVAANGSIVKAADGDPVRQSQYSRQIKELEDFFRSKLIERQGKGIRLTPNGKELARISRFFMLGLANFQRGCLAEEQVFRIGGSATFTRLFLLPALAGLLQQRVSVRYVTEIASTDEIERRLHDLTLDFGITCKAPLSRPLETNPLQEWKLVLCVPRSLRLSQKKAAEAFATQRLPLVLARKELGELGAAPFADRDADLVCDSFLEARAVLESQQVTALLPDFLVRGKAARCFMRVHPTEIEGLSFRFHLAWNPRLMRLNPHTSRYRDWLAQALTKALRRS